MQCSLFSTLGLLLAIVSVALCQPQRQGKGLGEVMENLWGGFSEGLDEFQVRFHCLFNYKLKSSSNNLGSMSELMMR